MENRDVAAIWCTVKDENCLSTGMMTSPPPTPQRAPTDPATAPVGNDTRSGGGGGGLDEGPLLVGRRGTCRRLLALLTATLVARLTANIFWDNAAPKSLTLSL